MAPYGRIFLATAEDLQPSSKLQTLSLHTQEGMDFFFISHTLFFGPEKDQLFSTTTSGDLRCFSFSRSCSLGIGFSISFGLGSFLSVVKLA